MAHFGMDQLIGSLDVELTFWSSKGANVVDYFIVPHTVLHLINPHSDPFPLICHLSPKVIIKFLVVVHCLLRPPQKVSFKINGLRELQKTCPLC